jgi:hypothetical protein
VAGLHETYNLDGAGVDLAFAAALRRVDIPRQDHAPIVEYGLERLLSALAASNQEERSEPWT